MTLMQCPVCSAEISHPAETCSVCGAKLTQSMVHYAGFWRRFLALVIDNVVLLLPVNLYAYYLSATIDELSDRIYLGAGTVVFRLSVFVLIMFYFAIMECSLKRATLGKMALGLYVTNMDGERLSFPMACHRNFGKVISALPLCYGFLMAGFTKRKQALHDLFAHTLVLVKKINLEKPGR